MSANTPLLTDEEIQNEAMRHCDNASAVRVDDYMAGAFYARELYEARLAEAILLMKEAAPAIDTISSGLSERFDRFLAIYTKEDKP